MEKYLGTVGLESLYVYLTVDCYLIICWSCFCFFFLIVQIFEEKYLVFTLFLLQKSRKENMWQIFHDCIFNLHMGKLRGKFALQTIAGNKPPTYRDNKTSKGL